MSRLRTLDRLLLEPLRDEVVLVRVDFNAPRMGDRILDDTRLRAALGTLRELSAAGARVVLLSHSGRPAGKPDPEYSLRPIADALSALLAQPVRFADDCIGEAAAAGVEATESGGFCLLENLRFHAGETANDDIFSNALAALGGCYVNDAFGCSHRAHASIVGLPARLGKTAAGRLVASEIDAFERLMTSPKRPFVAILGGVKISSKIKAIDSLLQHVDTLMLGGAMANTFLAARGVDLGASEVAQNELDVARRAMADAAKRGIEILLPVDLVVTDGLEEGDRPAAERCVETMPAGALPTDRMAVDVGARTLEIFDDAIGRSSTLFWNGPLGVFEVEPFDLGTRHLARTIATASTYSVAGGGETVAAIQGAGVSNGFDHVSTGGGAALALVAGAVLPGIEVLEDAS